MSEYDAIGALQNRIKDLHDEFERLDKENYKLRIANAELVELLKQKSIIISSMDYKFLQAGIVFDFNKDVVMHKEALAKPEVICDK